MRLRGIQSGYAVRLLAVLLVALGVLHQSCGGGSPYNPEADPGEQLVAALGHATGSRPVLMQVGGDWCRWCVRLNGFIGQHPTLSQRMREDFVWIHIYHGRERSNEAFIRSFLPEDARLSFPFFILLDTMGRLVGYYGSGALESGEGYDAGKLSDFLDRLQADYAWYWARLGMDSARGE